MKTSYFTKSAKHKNAVAITAKAPWFYKGRIYPKLAPKKWFLEKYKKDGNKKFYIYHYHKEVLSKLDPAEVFEELGEDAVLLCWEGPNKFCHRHLVAKWLSDSLGVKILELT